MGGDTVNILKFKAAMVAAGYNQRSLAEASGISENALSAKLNGKSRMYCDEAEICCKLFKLKTAEEKAEIFLSS